MDINCNNKIFSLFVGGIFCLYSLPIFASGFSFPANASLHWVGQDSDSGKNCSVTVKTDESRWVSTFLFEGFFAGRSFATPSGMGAVTGGFNGTANLFSKIAYNEFSYENHVFSDGVTVTWSSPEVAIHTIEAKFFGKDIENLEKIIYSDRGPFIWITGECRKLHP